MKDSFGRTIDYVRMSLTERCQLRCTYCSKETGGVCIKEGELSADDFVFIAKAFSELGFRTIRLTGGEPLMRRDILQIVGGINDLKSYEGIFMTTNGVMLEDQLDGLTAAGLTGCNVSIDSLNPDVYRTICGNELEPAFAGIKRALKVFGSIKLNVVLIKGVNDGEIDDFIDLTRENRITVRFIELMPLGGEKSVTEGVSNSEILENHPELMPLQRVRAHGNGPARYYKVDGYMGKVGFISPITCEFCKTCNRMRVTADGFLRGCLGVDEEIDIRECVKERDMTRLKELICEAIMQKPQKNHFSDCDFEAKRKMNRIGG